MLQSWAIAEGREGKFSKARTLFEQAHGIDPENIYVLQVEREGEGGKGRVCVYIYVYI